ncbi:MAG: transcriptional regulator [Bacteroidetes bacterium]|nr:transcriptional regulator [Bacteroidota bacterium]
MKAKLIKTKKEYNEALSQVEELMLTDLRKGTAEADEFELLTLLVHTYEEEHYPIPPPDPIGAIKFRMDQMGLPPSVLHHILGSRQRASDILNGRRKLTLPMIRRLHKELNIPAETLIGKD